MKKIISAFVLLTMVLSLSMCAFAAGEKNTNGYNVVIAMDSSGSLEYTDPNNYRFNAVNLNVD